MLNLSLYIQLKAKTVKADFEGLPSSVWTRFEADLKECYNWNGEFKKKRKKREVGEEEVDKVDNETDAGSSLLNWARELLLPSLVKLPRSFIVTFCLISTSFEYSTTYELPS